MAKTKGKLQIPAEVTVERINAYCDFIERHSGVWSLAVARDEGMKEPELVYSSAHWHREKIPHIYWQPSWGPRPRRRTAKTDAGKLEEKFREKFDLAGMARDRLAERLGIQEEAMKLHNTRFQEKLDALKAELEAKMQGKKESRPSRFERFRKELGRRLRILFKGGK